MIDEQLIVLFIPKFKHRFKYYSAAFHVDSTFSSSFLVVSKKNETHFNMFNRRLMEVDGNVIVSHLRIIYFTKPTASHQASSLLINDERRTWALLPTSSIHTIYSQVI